MPKKKPNCLPITLLVFFSIVLNVQICPSQGESTGVKCPNPNDIKYKNPKTGLIDHCMACPACPPSTQYSIPCGSIVGIGTGLGHCQDCPTGTFSSKLDKKQCQICTSCTNKVYLQNCTKHQNAKCGRCKPGYKYDHHIFGCIKTTRKTTFTTTASLTAAKPTAPTIPKIPFSTEKNTANSTSKPAVSSMLNNTVTSKSKITKTGFQAKTIRPTEVTEYPMPSSTLASIDNTSKATDNHTDPLTYVLFALFGTASLFLIGGFVIYCCIKWSRRRRSRKSKEEDAGINLLEMSNCDEQLLKDFLHKQFDLAESLYKVLYKQRRPLGTWDFEKVGRKWHDYIDDIDLSYIVELAKTPAANPVKMLLDKLCAEVPPPLTVRMLAISLKNINKRAYRILRPHFKITKSTVCILDETN